jgi:predicted ATPase
MPIDLESIRKVFSTLGYKRTCATKFYDEYVSPTTAQFIYTRTDDGQANSTQVVIHPDLKLEAFASLEKVHLAGAEKLLRDPRFRRFPERTETMRTQCSGRPITIESLEALHRFLQLLDSPLGSERVSADSPSRLIAIELENFKGIGDRVRINLAPITLLFGANSAGKSTILQALQYVREVLERRNANPDRTLYGGEFIDLGGFHNLVHQHDEGKTIAIKLELQLNRADLPELAPEAFDELLNVDAEAWDLYQLRQEAGSRTETVSVELKIGWSSNRQAAIVRGYEVGLNGALLAKIESPADGKDAAIEINQNNPVFIRCRPQEEVESAKDLFAGSDEDAATLTGDIDSDTADEDDQVYSIWLQITDALADANIEREGQGFRQWLSNVDGALPALAPLLYVPAGDAKGATATHLARELTAFLTMVIVGPGVLIRDQLRKLRYLGPVRNVPERAFEAALTPDDTRWADGTAAWETLLNGNESLVDEVSQWMADKDKLATGYEVTRRKFKEVDVSTLTWLRRAADPDTAVRPEPRLLRQLETAPEKRRIELRNPENGDPFQPRDVGIGISQVLPVVVAALEPSAALVAIEQPELHIHPAVQVGLGDLFIKGVKEHGTEFLVETHSEHLILRLLRRIREKTENEVPPGAIGIEPIEVAVIYVQSTDSGVQLVQLPIDKSGEFTVRWPKGFFPERAEELF